MLVRRRAAPLLALALFTSILLLLQSAIKPRSWPEIQQIIGQEQEVGPDEPGTSQPPPTQAPPLQTPPSPHPRPTFSPGTPPSPNHNYSKIVVMAKTHSEDTTWLSSSLPDMATAIYVADDASAPLHPPLNKGNEVMTYLSYIIDHYASLPDIILFMHAHRFSWHNNDLLGHDAAEQIRRLSSARVVRLGYVNLRCQWNPGCPAWIQPGRIQGGGGDEGEERELARVWSELFPLEDLPQVLAQPCCGQFALSRGRIRHVPLARFVFYRDWLLRTELRSAVAGRVWEYLWQYLFTGREVVCPDQHVCYCDGYGVCFESEDAFDEWFELRYRRGRAERELEVWRAEAERGKGREGEGEEEGVHLVGPEVGAGGALRAEVERLGGEMEERRQRALARGEDPRERARVAGRLWREGDGF